MRALLDTDVWFRGYHGLPMRPTLRRFLAKEVTQFHLCPLSVAEITFKWQRGRLKDVPDSATWVPHSLEHFELENLSATAAQQNGQWS